MTMLSTVVFCDSCHFSQIYEACTEFGISTSDNNVVVCDCNSSFASMRMMLLSNAVLIEREHGDIVAAAR